MRVNKRVVAGWTLMLAFCLFLPSLGMGATPYFSDQKVVYHNDGSLVDNPKYFGRLLGNLRNHVRALGREHIEIRVVSLGDGIELLQLAAHDKSVAEQIDALRADGVAFLLCNNTLVARGIDWHDLHGAKEQDVVPSGVAEVARLQQMGFVYLHP